MADEKLTPWNAPKTSEIAKKKATTQKSLNVLLQQGGSGSLKYAPGAHFSTYAGQATVRNASPKKKPKPVPLKWYQMIKKWKRRYKGKSLFETPFAYLYFLLLIGANAPGLIDGSPVSWGSAGLMLGLLVMLIMKRVSDAQMEKWRGWEDDLKKMEIEIETEARIRDEYRQRYGV